MAKWKKFVVLFGQGDPSDFWYADLRFYDEAANKYDAWAVQAGSMLHMTRNLSYHIPRLDKWTDM